jgi:hypothetical protein
MSNQNSQLDGLGSFNQSSQNAGTIKYGAFLNAARNYGTVALSASFGNTSINYGTIGEVIPIITASIVQQNSANWDAAYTAVVSNSAVWILSGGSGGGTGDATNAPIWDAVATYIQNVSSTLLTTDDGNPIDWNSVSTYVRAMSAKFLTSDGDYYTKWNNVFSVMAANSAAWMLSDTTNSPEWDATTSYVRANSASLVFTNDSRLADTPNGNAALTYLRANSADFVFDNDARLSNARTPVAHTHDASAIVSGKLNIDRLPILPSQEQVLIAGNMYTSSSLYYGNIDHFTYQLSAINQGTIVTTTDGYRWVYTGSGDKRYNTSYVMLADITPEWSAIANKPASFPSEWSTIANKPASFPVDGHVHDISEVTNLQSSLNTLQSNIDGKQASGNYALATDPRFTVLASNSAQWGDGTIQGYTASTYVTENSGSLVFTNDSRLTDSRTPLTHTHSIADISGLQTSLDSKASSSQITSLETSLDTKASVASVSSKASLSAFEELNTLVSENSGSWEGVGVVFNYFKTTSAAAVYSDDVRLARANTSFSYLTATSASLVTTSILNSSISGKVNNSELTNYVTTSDSRLTKADSAHSYVVSNSAAIVMTSDSRLTKANDAYTAIQSNSAAWSVGSTGSINYTIDGGGFPIPTGSKGFVQIPHNFVVQEWNIIADIMSTSFIVDVRKCSYANFPTTTTIVGGDTLTLTDQQKNRNSSASWTSINAGDFLEFYVTDASNASMINISLKGIRS